jgi:[ribosomal protein S18]-alanine N-acetyltransferase
VATEGGSDRGDERAVPAVAKGNAAPKPPVVERLTHLDVNDICALYKRVWDAFRPELPAELVKAWEPSPLEFTSWMEGVTYFSARRDGKMIGAIGCAIRDGSLQIVHLAVDPEARRQGIGTALINASLEWGRHNKANAVWVDALARFQAVAALLKDLGFAECGVLHRHRWNEDVRLFEKTL